MWSLRLRKVRPPCTRCRATHPQRVTRLPTSSGVNSPQRRVRETQLSDSLRGGSDGFEEAVVTAAFAVSAEAETEKAATEAALLMLLLLVFFESVLIDVGLIRNKEDRVLLERKEMKGRDLIRRDIAASLTYCNRV